jgi:UDP-N-acetylglucosamine 2-epimerase (non-hydrolysing)
MKEILLISGTRPEIIKLAPIYHALRDAAWTGVRWIHTGQHGAMARQIFASFDIEPDLSLERQGTSLTDFALGCRRDLDTIVSADRCAAVMVQGDTESAFQGALAGFYKQVPVAHVEAGLRTHNLERPFPEEGLRQMIARVAQFHFAPTLRARAALVSEGIAPRAIWVTGNTAIDAQHWVVEHKRVRRMAGDRGHLLVTTHRRENWGRAIDEVCSAVADIAAAQPDLRVLFPVHVNPAVQVPVNALLGHLPNVRLTPPLDYLEMQQALADAWLVLTDSGGLQEEAPTYRVPLLVLRDETERPEAVTAGCALVVGTSRAAVVSAVARLRDDEDAYRRMQQAGNPFGDGTAARRIVSALERQLARARPRAVAAA